MKSKKLFITAFATLMAMVITSCTNDMGNGDNPNSGITDIAELEGCWYNDVTGMTSAMWTYGECTQVTAFNSDGTGLIDVYYNRDEQPVAREHHAFTYTAQTDGTLTMELDSDKAEPATKWMIKGGKLTLADEEGVSMTYTKANADMEAKIKSWGEKELIEVPKPARYTVFIFGNASGALDPVIEHYVWGYMQQLEIDPQDVRVVCLYKYGNETAGKYGKSGDIKWFELNNKTDLNNLTDEHGLLKLLGDDTKAVKLCDPNNLLTFFEYSSLLCPAEDYILTCWGHGIGFDPLDNDVPGKYVIKGTSTRGMMSDEWNDYESVDMYELADAIKATRPDNKGRFNTIFFHNCLMGNMEWLTELRDAADYFVAEAHMLFSDGIIIPKLVWALQKTENTEDAMKLLFEISKGDFTEDTIPAEEGHYPSNADIKMIRSEAIDDIIEPTKRLAERLVELYPTKQEAIDNATKNVYRFYTGFEDPDDSWYAPFFDLADYAHKLAEETGDEEMTAIAKDIDIAFENAFVHYFDVNLGGQHLDHYTLSVMLYSDFDYNYLWSDGTVIGDNYEMSSFHKLTGWGYWLKINQQPLYYNPTSGSAK